MKKKKCVAMLLAGGQGTRLYALTSKVAKPAVSFGSKYRIIDFPLSNCVNSGFDTVGVLTQYQPLILNEYIGGGEPWDLDSIKGGAQLLSPYQAKSGGEWYKGTANAIYQNLSFLDRYDSEHVIILSGDHIYKMDYSLMLSQHIATNADCTIAVIDVPMSDASRFGILSHDEEGRIFDFEEKPKEPKSNHASMGVYIFKKEVLTSELIKDEKKSNSDHDFGKNIIPTMLNEGKAMYAYNFSGYWKDVGTVLSLWEANMDLINGTGINLNENWFKIYSRNRPAPPCYISDTGRIISSMVTAGCEIHGTVVNSVISENVRIGKNSVIKNSIIMRGSVIGDNVSINYGIIDENVTVLDGAQLGDENSCKDKITLVGRDFTVNKDQKVKAGTILEVLEK